MNIWCKSHAYVYFHTQSTDTFLQALELAVRTNPNISTNGEPAAWCEFAGKTDCVMALFERSRQLNPHIPGWYHITPFMAHAYRGEYEQALSEAQRIRTPSFIVDPIARTTALGYIGRRTAGDKVIDELLEVVPDFKESGRDLIQRFWRYEQPVGLILEGLRKAGLALN